MKKFIPSLDKPIVSKDFTCFNITQLQNLGNFVFFCKSERKQGTSVHDDQSCNNSEVLHSTIEFVRENF